MCLNRAKNTTARTSREGPVPFFVDGEWVTGDHEAALALDPATGQAICAVGSAAESQVDRAVYKRRSFDNQHWLECDPTNGQSLAAMG